MLRVNFVILVKIAFVLEFLALTMSMTSKTPSELVTSIYLCIQNSLIKYESVFGDGHGAWQFFAAFACFNKVGAAHE